MPTLPNLRYFLRDALDEFRHSPGVNVLATATLAASLFVAGMVLLVLSNVQGRLDQLRGDLRVQVFLREETTAAQREGIERTLGTRPEVARIVYVDKAQALERFREFFGEALADVSSELEGNPLPASFDVYLDPGVNPAEAASVLGSAVGVMDGVEEVRFEREWLDRVDGLLGVARMGGGLLAVLVFAAVGLVMASVLRLAVYARRDEIEIMRLVGATAAFVRGPFLVAGLAQGVVAALASLGLVEAARRGILASVGGNPVALVHLVAGRPLPGSLWALMICVGLVVSLAGSFFAVRGYE